jgi:hypothetical protein
MNFSARAIDDPRLFRIATTGEPVGHVMGAQATQGIGQVVPGARLGPAESGLDLRHANESFGTLGEVAKAIISCVEIVPPASDGPC